VAAGLVDEAGATPDMDDAPVTGTGLPPLDSELVMTLLEVVMTIMLALVVVGGAVYTVVTSGGRLAACAPLPGTVTLPVTWLKRSHSPDVK